MKYEEKAKLFANSGNQLLAIFAVPDIPIDTGVLIIVGGPQYRVGSHRQFVHLSRQLAEAGIPTMRFDYRGMGDAEGDASTFEEVEDDISAAIDVFFKEIPSMKRLVIWGLCDAASCALMYHANDPRIESLILANPWVRTDQGLANTLVKHYYGSRILQLDFWWKVLSGKLNLISSLKGFLTTLRSSKANKQIKNVNLPFPERMALGLESFSGHVVVILSGQDLTAKEFEEMTKNSPSWQRALKSKQVEWRRIPEATHTFSSNVWRKQVGQWTIDWVKAL